jgi:hypothetical protein
MITSTYTFQMSAEFNAEINSNDELIISISGIDLTDQFRKDISKAASNLKLSDMETEIFINTAFDAAYELMLIKRMREARV